MIYTIDLKIEAKTPAWAPKQGVVDVVKGLVYRVEFTFPPGCEGLAHLAVFDGGHQVWPSSLGETFCGDGQTVAFDDTYLKLAEPFQFEVYGYNLDELFPHTIYCRIGMVSGDIFMARFLPTYAYEHFMKLIEEEQKRQEERVIEVLEYPFPGKEE